MGFRAVEVHSLQAQLYQNTIGITAATRIGTDIGATIHTCLAFSALTVKKAASAYRGILIQCGNLVTKLPVDLSRCYLRRCLRIPVSDMEGEDIGRYFNAAQAFIDGALAAGGAVLVHCHEGKSRSVTLVLAYFMKTKVTP